MTHYSFYAELASRPAVIGLRNTKPFCSDENRMYDPKMRDIKGTEKKSDMVPYYDIEVSDEKK